MDSLINNVADIFFLSPDEVILLLISKEYTYLFKYIFIHIYILLVGTEKNWKVNILQIQTNALAKQGLRMQMQQRK